MTFPKFIAISAFGLFGFIAMLAFLKKDEEAKTPLAAPIEISLEEEHLTPSKSYTKQSSDHPDVDNLHLLFNRVDPKFPIVETITYKSRVSWLKGRPAWVSDYAAHYKTSRHFIARSLNGQAEYFKQNVGEGDRFNVFKEDKEFTFHLVIDLSCSKMWFYYHDLDSNERKLIKTYSVGLGRLDETKTSGSLTPLGKYSLGEKVVIYKPKMYGYHNGDKTEMITVFGTRWIPFEKEIEGCTAPAKGFGLHGVPWVINEQGELVQDSKEIAQYESDGCIRLSTADIEELFAIIITKPTEVEIVRDVSEATLPGIET